MSNVVRESSQTVLNVKRHPRHSLHKY